MMNSLPPGNYNSPPSIFRLHPSMQHSDDLLETLLPPSQTLLPRARTHAHMQRLCP